MKHVQTHTPVAVPLMDEKSAAQKRVSAKTSFIKVLKANRGFLFVLPALILFLVLGFYTVIYSFILSFFRWNGYGGFTILPPSCIYPCQFVGLDNFREFLYQNPTQAQIFWQSVEQTAIMGIVVTVGTIIIALPLAMALNRAIRGVAFFRTAIVLPMVTAGAAIYYVWSFIYDADGLLNGLLKFIGLGAFQDPNGWLGDPVHALPSLIAVLIWNSVPLGSLLYLTGLQTLNQDLIEAALIDGANAWQRLGQVIWPLLRPITVIVLILTLNGILQGSYEMVYLMTGGGPAGHTNVVGLVVFNYGFGNQQELGMASAISWMMFLVIFLIALGNLRLFRSQE